MAVAQFIKLEGISIKYIEKRERNNVLIPQIFQGEFVSLKHIRFGKITI